MRRAITLAVMLLGVASAQWLERVLWLPDSMSHVDGRNAFLPNPDNGRLYIANPEWGRIHFLDMAVRRKTGFSETLSEPAQMFACPDRHRVYVIGEDGNYLAMFDSRSDSLLKVIYDVVYPSCGVYNPQTHRAYVGAYDECRLFVFDPGPDTLLYSLPLLDEVNRLALDPATNRLFSLAVDGGGHALTVIDCSADTVYRYLPGPTDFCMDLAFDPAARRLYVIGFDILSELTEVWTYDMDSLRLLDTLALPEGWAGEDCRLFLNPATRHLYAYAYQSDGEHRPSDHFEDSIAVIDCATNVVERFIWIEDCEGVTGMAANLAHGRTYVCTWDRESTAVLGLPDSITGWIPVSAHSPFWNSGRDELYLPGFDDFLYFVDGATDTITGSLSYQALLINGLAAATDRRRLYVLSDRGVSVVDSLLRPEKWLRVGFLFGAGAMAPAPEFDRLYVTGYPDSLFVVSTATDSVIGRRALSVQPPFGMSRCSTAQKLYFGDQYGTAAVYHCGLDSLLYTRTGFGQYFATNGPLNRLYGYGPQDSALSVIDPRTDTVLSRRPCPPLAELAVNPADTLVYGVSWERPGCIYVFDGRTGVWRDTLSVSGYPGPLTWQLQYDRLYAATDSVIAVFDCRTGQLLHTVNPRTSYVNALLPAGPTQLYVSGYAALSVLQCPEDSVIATFDIWDSRVMSWAPNQDRVFVSGFTRLFVINTGNVGIEAGEPPDPGRPLRLFSNPSRGPVRLLCDVSGPARLLVFDACGRLVWQQSLAPGLQSRTVVWPRSDSRGHSVPAGVYLARLESAAGSSTVKVVLR
jgi:DNA-binding beta-propeller fold protein YncE